MLTTILNKVKILTLLSSFFLISCARGDLGRNYTLSNANSNKNPVKKIQTPDCPFKDVQAPKNVHAYNHETEKAITQLFSKYVTSNTNKSDVLSGQVKYLKWWASKKDLALLCEVNSSIRKINPNGMSDNEKKAFFINAYNTFTIELILNFYTDLEDTKTFKKSIKNINNLGDSVWDVFEWKINGENYSLNKIEKEILIPMKDARIHFAVNCASKGCPPLRNEAFTSKRLDQQLDEMSSQFINNKKYTIIEYLPESGEGDLGLTNIFKWYKSDFVNDNSGKFNSVRSFIVHFLDSSQVNFPKESILNEDKWFDYFYDYDWELNEQELN